jgi:hypothetical protein
VADPSADPWGPWGGPPDLEFDFQEIAAEVGDAAEVFVVSQYVYAGIGGPTRIFDSLHTTLDAATRRTEQLESKPWDDGVVILSQQAKIGVLLSDAQKDQPL